MRVAVRLLLASLALLGLASGFNRAPHLPAENDYIYRQKRLLQILWHIGQPTPYPELRKIAISFKPEEHVEYFKNPEHCRTFVKYYSQGYFRRRGESFSVHYKSDLLQVRYLVDLLYYANDFDIFFKTAVWARENLNPGLFLHALNVVKHHREDLYDLVFPPLYEIYPHLFVSNNVISEAWRAALEGKTFNKERPYVIRADHWGHPHFYSADGVLSYHTEDVGLQAVRHFLSYRSPFWAKGEGYNLARDIHTGDYFYSVVKNALSRYYLERLSNHLPDIEPINYEDAIFGIKSDSLLIRALRALETRLWDAIDSGYVLGSEFNKLSLRDPTSIDIFGRILEGNVDPFHKDYYGSFYHSLLEYLGRDGDSYHHTAEPCLLNRLAYVFRSPLFYRLLKRVVLILDAFKNRLEPYSWDELALAGVKVKSLNVDKLVTYFEDYDFHLNNAIPVASHEEASKLNVVARTRRLSHNPFNYQVNVFSEQETNVSVRFFIGPRYDSYGKEFSLNEKRHNMVYLDSFVYKLQRGENRIVRKSHEFSFHGQQQLSYRQLWDATEAGRIGDIQPFGGHSFGRHARGSLPRGSPSGLPLSTYVIVNPIEHKSASNALFPFDRPVNELHFDVPNAHFGEAVVFHKESHEALHREEHEVVHRDGQVLHWNAEEDHHRDAAVDVVQYRPPTEDVQYRPPTY